MENNLGYSNLQVSWEQSIQAQIDKIIIQINKEIRKESLRYKLKPRLRIQYKRQFYSTKKESSIILRRGEEFSQNKIIKDIKYIKQITSKNTRILNMDSFENKLKDFYLKYLESNKYRCRRKIRLQKSTIKQILNNNKGKAMTLKQIREAYISITKENGFSISSLRRQMLKEMGFQYTTTLIKNKKINTLQNHIMLLLYLQKIARDLSNNSTLFFLDETNIKENKNSSKLWIDKSNCDIVYNNGRTESYSIIGSISSCGINHFKVLKEPTTSETFVKFINELEIKLKNDQLMSKCLKEGNVIVITDNAKPHTSAYVRRHLKKSQMKVLYLPTYQSTLNPIEYVWGIIKKKTNKEVHCNM